jgi:RNA polymerase sigma-70 factor (ECF subfamily)
MGVPESDVPDVAQEVFVILRRKLHNVRSPAALRSFIYGIALREASDHRRQARVRYERVAPSLPEAPVEPTQERELERARAIALLERALGHLDEDKRAVFVLYELEELDMREVASAVGCPLQTAYSRLHAARAAVTAAFERAGHTPRSER